LIDGNDGEVIKLDLNGEEIARVQRGDFELEYRTHFAFTENGVCDFSTDNIKVSDFSRVIKASKELTIEKWKVLFESYYDEASVVIYEDFETLEYQSPIYFKIDDEWILLQIFHYDLENGETFESLLNNYPPKYNRLIFLKDMNVLTYSDLNAHTGSRLDKKYRNDFMHEPVYLEDELDYRDERIEKLAFIKRSVSDRLAYVGLVSRFVGDGYYRLSKDSDTLKFKENAFKDPFILYQSDGYLNHFTLPLYVQSKKDVSFIKYSFPTNQNESNSQGVYLLKRKQ